MKYYLSIINLLYLLLFIIISGCGNGNVPSSVQPSEQNNILEIAPTSQSPTQMDFSAAKLPKGLLVNTNNSIGLTFVNLQGQAIAEIKTPGISFSDPTTVHIAGKITDGKFQAPLVYQAYDPQPALMVNIKDQISVLMKTENFFLLSGAPGIPLLAYSQVNQQEKGIESKLYVSKLDTLASAKAVITQFDDQTYMAITPIMVDAQGETIQGVWFTKSAWGIGGDIVFAIQRGLYYFDYTAGAVNEYLTSSHDFQGLSLDRTFAASVEPNPDGKTAVNFLNLKDKSTSNFLLDINSDRGAGDVFFSPDNHYVAWMEASGTHMSEPPNFHSRIRVIQMGEKPVLVRDLNETTISQNFGYPAINFMKPVGWLDNQTLLIEMHQESWEKVSLLRLDVASGTVVELWKGSFVGFIYE